MQVSVLFFASLRDAAGSDALSVNLEEDTDVGGLLKALERQLGPTAAAALKAENVRIAVNQTLTTGPQLLRDGDEVAFLPPVTGG